MSSRSVRNRGSLGSADPEKLLLAVRRSAFRKGAPQEARYVRRSPFHRRLEPQLRLFNDLASAGLRLRVIDGAINLDLP